LSDLELRYPFAPRSKSFFERIPMEESMASKEVVTQSESRLLSSLGRAKYEPHLSEFVEFSSFFTSALVASQDPVLTSRFSKKEAERAKEFFLREKPGGKVVALSECFGVGFVTREDDSGRRMYDVPFDQFLKLTSKLELNKNPKWKLVRQELASGTVRMGDNALNDLFGDCAQVAIAEGVRNLRRAQFPKQLGGIKSSILQYVPVQRPKVGKGYEYVEDLLKHPVTDGRHRLVWLVLAPYLVNIKKLEDEDAIGRIRGFVAAAGESSEMKRFVEYNVRRARRNGLLPPRFSTLRTEHPDIYGLLPKEVVESQLLPNKKDRVNRT